MLSTLSMRGCAQVRSRAASERSYRATGACRLPLPTGDVMAHARHAKNKVHTLNFNLRYYVRIAHSQ